jgi:hypothetical protein
LLCFSFFPKNRDKRNDRGDNWKQKSLIFP